MSGYTKALQRHLTAYKNRRLGVEESGIFLHRGKEVRCGHILPRQLKWLNILEPFRSEIREYLREHRTIRLHKYFHHLNSSQAFALNLFFPYFQCGASEALLRALGQEGAVSKWQPELVADAAEGTNVDVAWQNATGAWTYCEVKLSEQEFGQAEGARKHHDKLQKTYGPALANHCPPELLEPAKFFGHYQILRNIWLAACSPTASVIFLLPRRNEGLWEPLREIEGSLQQSLRSRVHLVAIEDVIDALAANNAIPPRLSWYAEMLREKYVPP